MAAPLQVDVFYAPPIPAVTGSHEPSKQWWSPCSIPLIHGPKSAVLGDTTITIDQATALADWIEKIIPGKKLEYVFVTHGHGDHFLGFPILAKRFPGVKLVATAKVASSVKDELEPEPMNRKWRSYFPGQLAEGQVAPEALPEDGRFGIDGHEFQAIDVGYADFHASSFLHVPSLRLVVSGDIVYGDCYQHLAEANTAKKRSQWKEALDMIEALDPQIVVPGHKRESQVDGAYLIDATRKYILAFEAELERTSSGEQLEARMKELYPQRWNDFILGRSCAVSFASKGA